MASEDDLARLLNAWRKDINSEPFPLWTGPLVPAQGGHESIQCREATNGHESVRVRERSIHRPETPKRPGAGRVSR
jgi:hypothetical protein